MSTKIEYEDGSVYFEPEPSETRIWSMSICFAMIMRTAAIIRTVFSIVCATD